MPERSNGLGLGEGVREFKRLEICERTSEKPSA